MRDAFPRPGEDPQWDAFVADFRADAVSKIAESALTISLVPGGDEADDHFDVKFAVELGASIMLDKPIVLLAIPGRVIPPGLRRVAHAVIELEHDLDTEAGQQEAQTKITEAVRRFGPKSP